MPRPQFSLKTFLWLMAVVAVFFFGYIAGGGRERQQLEAGRKRLIDWSYDLDVQQNRLDAELRRQNPGWCNDHITRPEAQD